MTDILGIGVYPAATPEEAVKDMDIVITAIIASTRFMLAEYQPRPRITAG